MAPIIAYYVNNSIHHIPAFIYIARELGGTVFTDGPDSYAVLTSQYPDVPAEYHQTKDDLRARLTELKPAAVVQPDYTRWELGLEFETVHVQVFHGTSDKSHGVSKRVNDYDLLLISGKRKLQRMAGLGRLRPGHYALVGYPKVDRVFRGVLDRDVAVHSLGLDPARPTVLYAPTWRDNKQNSSLGRFGSEVMSAVPDDYNLVVKLHPNTRLYDKEFYPLAQRLAAVNPRIRLVEFEHDIIPIMAAADLLLCDVSTVSHEFLCFNRPMVFLDPRILPFGKDKTWIWQCGRVVRSRGRVWPTVVAEMARPDACADKRVRLLGEVFHAPDGCAAKRSAEAIMAYLAGTLETPGI